MDFLQVFRSVLGVNDPFDGPEQAPPAKQDRPPPRAAAPPASAVEQDGDKDAAGRELFRGLLDDVSAEVKELASPHQRERFEQMEFEVPPASAPRQQSPESQEIDDAIAKSRAAGGSRVDQVLAGGHADEGNVTFDGRGFRTGQQRLIEMMHDTAGVDITEKNLKDPRGKIDQAGKKISWCGIWAADIWRRAGVPVKWENGRMVDEKTSEPLHSEGIDAHQQADLARIQPGDVVTINTKEVDRKNHKEGATNAPTDRNHHAIVESTVYQSADGKDKVTVPPGDPPEGGKILGFNIVQGNDPELRDAKSKDPYFDSNHPGFVPAEPTKSTDDAGNKYETGITVRIPLPGEKPPEAPPQPMEWEEDPKRPGKHRPVTPEDDDYRRM